MKVVIDIDDKLYERITIEKEYYLEDGEYLCSAIKNGTPLPKCHGRLGDLDKLEKDMKNYIIFNVHDCVELVNCADTIIEADAQKRRKGTPREDYEPLYDCENWIP